jgi:hypothetical protein
MTCGEQCRRDKWRGVGPQGPHSWPVEGRNKLPTFLQSALIPFAGDPGRSAAVSDPIALSRDEQGE